MRQARRYAQPRVTQEDLAARVQAYGVPLNQASISKIEKGTRVVTDIELKAINKGATAEDLKDQAEPDKGEELKPLLDKIKSVLGDKVKEVRASVRLADSPLDRGRALAELGLWGDAAALWRKSSAPELEADVWLWDRHAALLALEQELEKYRPYLQLTPTETLERMRTAPISSAIDRNAAPITCS